MVTIMTHLSIIQWLLLGLYFIMAMLTVFALAGGNLLALVFGICTGVLHTIYARLGIFDAIADAIDE